MAARFLYGPGLWEQATVTCLPAGHCPNIRQRNPRGLVQSAVAKIIRAKFLHEAIAHGNKLAVRGPREPNATSAVYRFGDIANERLIVQRDTSSNVNNDGARLLLPGQRFFDVDGERRHPRGTANRRK